MQNVPNIDAIVASNKGLVYSQLHRFNLVCDANAESYAFEALYKAINTFDVSRNIKLSTYATVCIYNALGSYMRTFQNACRIEYIALDPSIAAPVDIEHEYLANQDASRLREVLASFVDDIPNEKHKLIYKVWAEHDYEISTAEIAKIVKVSQPHVSLRLAIFRNKLKQKLKEWYHG